MQREISRRHTCALCSNQSTVGLLNMGNVPPVRDPWCAALIVMHGAAPVSAHGAKLGLH